MRNVAPVLSRGARLFRAGTHPAVGPRAAGLRQTQLTLTTHIPRPTAIAVFGVTSGVGTTTVAALVAQGLHALAPAQVVILDGDGTAQPQRALLNAGSAGDVRAMLQSVQAHRIRRAVESFVALDGRVPLASAAGGDRRPLEPSDLLAALRLLRRRWPIAVLDLASADRPHRLATASGAFDHVVIMVPRRLDPQALREWWTGPEVGRRHDEVTIVASMPAEDEIALAGAAFDVELPFDPVLDGPVPLEALALPTLAAVQAILARIAHGWSPMRIPD
jgi:hypothetical protein